jgi:long-subunit acyl-CoA synthetase (AMP-forming)
VADTVDALFREAVRRFPERPFLRALRPGGELRLSYGEAACALASAALDLQARGLHAGDRAVLYLEESFPSVLLNLACAHAGVVPVPLSPVFSMAARDALVAQTGARALFSTGDALDFRPRHALAEALEILDRIARDHGPHSPYVFQPTSGSTGQPKLVVRPHAAFVRTAKLKAFDLRAEAVPQERVLLVAALTHGMGQYELSTALVLAAELCIPSRIDIHTPLDEVRALDPTYLCMTPRVLRALFEQSGGAHPFGPSARIFLVGGSATDAPLLQRVAAAGIDVIEAYGASEISLLSLTRRGKWRPGSSGEALPDVSLKIADDGELLARSPARMIGYFGDEGLTRDAFTDDGWYKTGDFCQIGADRELRYLGRKKEVFNTFEGANVHPSRIEAMIEALPWVAQVVLLGDQRPFLAALIVVSGALDGDAGDGFLDEARHPSVYARAREDLRQINAGLEAMERIVRVALFAQPMPAALYRTVGHAKIARDRAGVAQRYAARIQALYDSSTENGRI